MNTISMGVLSALISVSLASAGCDGGDPQRTPALPTGPAQPAAVTYTLSGIVSETTASGTSALEGARILDLMTGRTAVTDVNGLYSLSGLTSIPRTVSISKGGYTTQTRTLSLTGDIQLEVSLERIPSFVLSGVVFEVTEAGRVPVEGVELYCDSCGSPEGHTFVDTDANGFYRFEWTFNGVHPLFVRKSGYDIHDPTGTVRDQLGRVQARVDGDTRFDIQLVRR